MILEKDSLLNFSYDTSTHILTVTYPDMIGTPLTQIENSLEKLARTILIYDIKKVLLDLRSGVPGVDEENYKELVFQLHSSLTHTRLKKLARLVPEDPAREYLIRKFPRETREKLDLTFTDRSFTNKQEAIRWLLEA